MHPRLHSRRRRRRGRRGAGRREGATERRPRRRVEGRRRRRRPSPSRAPSRRRTPIRGCRRRRRRRRRPRRRLGGIGPVGTVRLARAEHDHLALGEPDAGVDVSHENVHLVGVGRGDGHARDDLVPRARRARARRASFRPMRRDDDDIANVAPRVSPRARPRREPRRRTEDASRDGRRASNARGSGGRRIARAVRRNRPPRRRRRRARHPSAGRPGKCVRDLDLVAHSQPVRISRRSELAPENLREPDASPTTSFPRRARSIRARARLPARSTRGASNRSRTRSP